MPGPPPLHRSELYQLWWRQELFDGKLILRVGKMVPTADFNNVLRPVPMQDQSLFIPSVSGLLFTPVFVNPTLLGVMPGYYNSACGVTTTFAPTKNFYFSIRPACKSGSFAAKRPQMRQTSMADSGATRTSPTSSGRKSAAARLPRRSLASKCESASATAKFHGTPSKFA